MTSHLHSPFKFCPQCASELVLMLQMSEERLTCPNCGWVHYEDPKVAAGVLVLREREVLLVRRTMEPCIRQWSIPAGFVNAFEDPQAAAVRECREETGLDVRIEALFDVLYGREHPRGADIILVYRAEVISGTLSAADDADQAVWFPLDQLPALAFETTRKIFAKLSQPSP
ncbi:MAG: NUDIX hydrolase [Anaerolineaceae bacterium]|nr:NUDIX hydrolase [Anaerolineaceae bacterium]